MTAALDLLARVPTILVFLTALTVVAECCAIAGVFESFTDRLVVTGRGRVWSVWALLVLASVLVTAFLSLDTTAVLMTSAAVTVAHRLHRPVMAFTVPVLWSTNMASMWLPVSNLTTLLARDVLPHPGALGYLMASWPVALTTTLVPLVLAALVFRRHLGGRVEVAEERPEDRHPTARRAISGIVVVMSVALLFVEPAWAAGIAALACYAVVWSLVPERRREVRLPWSSLLFTSALFLAVAVLHGLGVLDPLTTATRHAPAWALGVVGGVTANAVNNLPAYLALEPAAHGDTTRLIALLIGVNVASGLTWWGSVGTLLWRDRVRRGGETVTYRDHLRLTGPVTVVTAAAALLVAALTG